MTCKYCGKEDAVWGENWKPGDKMIETETGTIHTIQRCKELQNPQHHKVKKEWYRVKCIECECETRRNPKHFKKPDPGTFTCEECESKKFINLGEYGIGL